jgi:hypothetical protein
MPDFQQLQITDFSGGMTDYSLGGDIRQNEKMDNFVISENTDAVTRPGSLPAYNFRITATNTIKGIIDHNLNILLQAGPKVFYQTTLANEILSPQGRSVFQKGDDTQTVTSAYWNGHTIAVSDSYASPQKIFKDVSGNWKTQTLGMPDIIYAWAIKLANDIKSGMNTHFLSIAQHSSADTTHIVVTPDASDIDSLLALTQSLVTAFTAHESDARLSSGRLYHIAQTSTSAALATALTPHSVYDCYQILLDFYTKVNLHAHDTVPHTIAYAGNIGPAYPLPVCTPGAPSTGSYLYAMYFTYRYNVGDIQFIERGKPYFLSVTNGNTVGYSATLTLHGLNSGAIESWDDANVYVTICRTTNGGTTFYEIKDIANSTSMTITDTTIDTDLVLKKPAYFEGGVADNDLPPRAKFVEILNDTAFFANVKEGSDVRANRLRISKPSNISACPEFYYEDFDNEITAMSAVGTYPIVFLKNKCYRVEGGFDSSGRGTISKRTISLKTGCIAPKSVVKTKDAVFFAAEDGFYMTNGFSVTKISPDINVTYKALPNKQKINGCFDKLRNWVYWSVQRDAFLSNNEQMFVANLNYHTPLGGMPFTTWSGGLDPLNFSATALEYIDNVLYRADSRGYLLKHDESVAQDVYVDTAILPNAWNFQTIHYTLTSVAFDFGITLLRKWAPKISFVAQNSTSMSLQIAADNDNSGVFVNLVPVLKKGNIEWGDATIIWNDVLDILRWNFFPALNVWRWMKATVQAMRCMYKKIKWTNAYVDIDSSVTAGLASSDGFLNTVTLLSYPTSTWLTDCVNYYISFDTDLYTLEYLIIGISGATITVSDTGNTLPTSASLNWKIRGYKKREGLSLIEYTIPYAQLTMTQETAHKGT